MPITAKLSRKFYDKLGDDVANELVEWLNAVDTSYRQEFKDLFEANFGRMEARLEARLVQQSAGFDVKLQQAETRLVRWMFGFWIGAIFAIIGGLAALRQLHL
jgi:hypothetical protein